VSLTLLSGNPVTFRQSLFESYYVARPNVPVEVAGRVLPKPDTGSIEGELGARDAATPSPARLQKATGMARSAAEAAPAAPPPGSAPAQIEAAQAAESVTQTVFTLPYKVVCGQRGKALCCRFSIASCPRSVSTSINPRPISITRWRQSLLRTTAKPGCHRAC